MSAQGRQSNDSGAEHPSPPQEAYRADWGGEGDSEWPNTRSQEIIFLAAMDCISAPFCKKRGGVAAKLRRRTGLLLPDEIAPNED
jgi:hypothetical protein